MHTLPERHQALVEQLRDALASVCGERYFLIASKGPTRDVIAGLSDMDFRLVIDCAEPATWRTIMRRVGDVFITFAHERREHWRLVEHLPATAYRPSELNHQPVCDERVGWEVLHESQPG